MARLFDRGSTEYLEAALAAISTTPNTMSCWFRLEADLAAWQQGVLMGIWDASDADGEGFYLYTDTDNKSSNGYLYLAQRTSGATSTISYNVGGDITGAVYHACGVNPGYEETWLAYLNGSSNSAINYRADPANLDVTTIGARAMNNSHDWSVDGWVAEPAIWNVALTDVEVWLLSRGIPPPLIRPQSLVAYWPLFNHDRDAWNARFNLTAFNTPSWAPHPQKALSSKWKYQHRAGLVLPTRTRI